MVTNADARSVLEALVGRQIRTVTGRPNTVMALDGADVLVATDRSPTGQRVPIAHVQSALDRLRADGEVEVSVSALGHRSSFVGAVLSELPGTVLARMTPPRIRLADPMTAYRASEAGHVNAWWRDDQRQRFWLEITDRSDIGVDLHCPQRDSAGNRSPGFSLMWWVRVGDIVFHYSLNEQAIVGWSRAVGQVAEAPTLWLPHRGETPRTVGSAQVEPGWWLDLDGSFPLDAPLTLDKLQDHADQIRDVLDQLKSRNSGSLYFPFFFWRGTELRPMQPYLNKLPAEVVGIIPELAAAVAAAEPIAADPLTTDQQRSALGSAYRVARVNAMGDSRQPFSVDPALVERGLRGHADTQNALARVLTGAGIEPRSRLPHEPNYDLAWQIGNTVYVAEVKSTTDENEEEQLRLGLGQVLRYRHSLSRLGHVDVVAVLVPERDPRDDAWRELCSELGVVLMSGAELEQAPVLARRSGVIPVEWRADLRKGEISYIDVGGVVEVSWPRLRVSARRFGQPVMRRRSPIALQKGHARVVQELLITAVSGYQPTIGQLAERANVDMSTASRAISQLADHGLVVKKRIDRHIVVELVNMVEVAERLAAETAWPGDEVIRGYAWGRNVWHLADTISKNSDEAGIGLAVTGRAAAAFLGVLGTSSPSQVRCWIDVSQHSLTAAAELIGLEPAPEEAANVALSADPWRVGIHNRGKASFEGWTAAITHPVRVWCDLHGEPRGAEFAAQLWER